MSVFDIDVASRRNPDTIRNKEFAKVRRGYDPDQVNDYLNQIAGWVDQLERELRQARTELSTMSRRRAQPERDPYERLGSRVAEIIRAADEFAEQTRREASEEAGRQLSDARANAERQLAEAREEAEKQLTEARGESERMRREAKSEAQRLRVAADQAIARARTEAETLLSNLMQRRDALLGELTTYRERLVGLVGQLEPVVKSPPAMPEPALPGPVSGGNVPPPPRSLTEPFDPERFEDRASSGGSDEERESEPEGTERGDRGDQTQLDS